MLTFDEDSHTYFFDGEEVPSVTQILNEVGLTGNFSSPATLDGMERGKLVHQACEFLDYDDLVLESLDPAIEPYVKAYQKFKDETGFKPELIEKRLYHPELRYAGTLDRVGEMRGERVVIDLKTSKNIDKVVGLQLAAYEMALNNIHILPRYAVQLKNDGSYLLHSFGERSDLIAFESAVKLYHWKKNVKKERVRKAA